ncbi:MAG: hypothetical protein DRM98_03270 [Thermoplasmata archaeon]|nr:MAG: hypothetical protein DRM98_03270 [Thermoplasmata archaeon]
MNAKHRRGLDFRTTLYILVGVVIAVSIIYVILNPVDESQKVYTSKEILTNKNLFVNKKITVEGIYHSRDNAVGMTTTDPNPYDPYMIPLDGSKIENFTAQVSDGTKYRFTGTLEWASPLHTDVILVVDKFKIV